MESHALSVSVHFLGLLFWMSGLLSIAVLGKIAVQENSGKYFASAFRKLTFGFMLPGILLVILSGLYQVFGTSAGPVYLKQGWLHAKLTIVFVMLGLSLWLPQLTAKLSRGEQVSATPFRVTHGIVGLGLLVIIVLAEMKPF